jgi:peptidoglycan/LPS O-acetylase OafA/YrhL
MLYTEDRLPFFANWQAAILGIIALYLFSFTYEQKLLIHAPLKAIMPPGDTSHFIWDAGAVLMILLLLGNPTLRRVFSHSWAIWLGLLSFPIYLLHGPIMLSAGATVFNATDASFGHTGSILFAVTISILLTLACAFPLIWIDQAWTKFLSRLTKPFLKKPATPSKSPIPTQTARLQACLTSHPPGPTSYL